MIFSRIATQACTALLAVLALTGCVSSTSVKSDAANTIQTMDVLYGKVTKITSMADNPQNILDQSCRVDSLRVGFEEICKHPKQYNRVVFRYYVPVSGGVINAAIYAKNDIQMQVGSIIATRFDKFSQLGVLVAVAALTETPSCKWMGNDFNYVVPPGTDGGVECNGWSYTTKLRGIDFGQK